MNKGMFSSNTDDWATPLAFFKQQDEGKGTAPFPSALVVFNFGKQIQTFGILKRSNIDV